MLQDRRTSFFVRSRSADVYLSVLFARASCVEAIIPDISVAYHHVGFDDGPIQQIR